MSYRKGVLVGDWREEVVGAQLVDKQREQQAHEDPSEIYKSTAQADFKAPPADHKPPTAATGVPPEEFARYGPPLLGASRAPEADEVYVSSYDESRAAATGKSAQRKSLVQQKREQWKREAKASSRNQEYESLTQQAMRESAAVAQNKPKRSNFARSSSITRQVQGGRYLRQSPAKSS